MGRNKLFPEAVHKHITFSNDDYIYIRKKYYMKCYETGINNYSFSKFLADEILRKNDEE